MAVGGPRGDTQRRIEMRYSNGSLDLKGSHEEYEPALFVVFPEDHRYYRIDMGCPITKVALEERIAFILRHYGQLSFFMLHPDTVTGGDPIPVDIMDVLRNMDESLGPIPFIHMADLYGPYVLCLRTNYGNVRISPKGDGKTLILYDGIRSSIEVRCPERGLVDMFMDFFDPGPEDRDSIVVVVSAVPKIANSSSPSPGVVVGHGYSALDPSFRIVVQRVRDYMGRQVINALLDSMRVLSAQRSIVPMEEAGCGGGGGDECYDTVDRMISEYKTNQYVMNVNPMNRPAREYLRWCIMGDAYDRRRLDAALKAEEEKGASPPPRSTPDTTTTYDADDDRRTSDIPPIIPAANRIFTMERIDRGVDCDEPARKRPC
jgi:hypothetical protein